MAGEQLVPWIDSGDAEGNRNSMQNFEGDGTTTSWDFNFAGGYIDVADVKAYIYRGASGLTEAIDPVVLTGPNTIQVIPAVPVGDFLVVYRDTPKDMPLVNYSTGAVLDEANLDKSNNQAIFVAAEMSDRFDAINASSADAIERSFEALTIANAADDKADIAIADSANAVATAALAETTAAEALQVAEDAVAASVGFQTNLEFYTGDDVTSRGADWQTGSVASPGVQRWFAGTDTASDFTIDRYNDAGVLQGSPVKVDRQTGNVALEADLDMTGGKIANVASGTAASDAANKGQVDAVLTEANAQKIDKDGTLDFAAHQKLFNSQPTDPLHAASRGYVDTLNGRRNLLMNTQGLMRTGGGSIVSGYFHDRWVIGLGGGATATPNEAGITAADLVEFKALLGNSGRQITGYQTYNIANGGSGAGAASLITQGVEDVRRFSGEKMTLSLLCRGTGTLGFSVLPVINDTAVNEALGINIGTKVLSGSWQLASFTFDTPLISSFASLVGFHGLMVRCWFSAGSNYSAQAGIGLGTVQADLTGWQLEYGDHRSQYQYVGAGLDDQDCRRYFERVTVLLRKTDTGGSFGGAAVVLPFQVSKRIQLGGQSARCLLYPNMDGPADLLNPGLQINGGGVFPPNTWSTFTRVESLELWNGLNGGSPTLVNVGDYATGSAFIVADL